MLTDGYKLLHHEMFPPGTVFVYSNGTPRSFKHANKRIKRATVAGLQAALHKLKTHFNENFFSQPKEKVIGELKFEFSLYTGIDYDVTHFEKLHDLGYLPILVKGLDEGSQINEKIPVFTICNTHKDFYWLPNYLETILSNLIWLPMNSATIAKSYYDLLYKYALETDEKNVGFVNYQAHDFSMRGMGGLNSTILSGIGHAFVFTGSDNIPVISALRNMYGATGGIVHGVPATEHSVMCAGNKDDEIGTFKRLLELYPNGILSIVSDTWDLWKVCTEYLPALKDNILARNGKLVIRPDSGNPADIICGEKTFIHKEELCVERKINDFPGFETIRVTEAKVSQNQIKGVVELLWDTFGGTINDQGYKVLDSHIGCIYGDSITLDIAEDICERLKAKGFASTNVVFGIGSFTYQFNTRDTLGFAMKATYCEIETPHCTQERHCFEKDLSDPCKDGCVMEGGIQCRELFKDPITDNGVKKSAKGLLAVLKDENNEFYLKDQVTKEEEETGELKVRFRNGVLYNTTTLDEVRSRLRN
jgi:nicotinamide phosphoribosyltransferase